MVGLTHLYLYFLNLISYCKLLFSHLGKRSEWKNVIDDAFNEEVNLNLIRRAFSTITAWEARFLISYSFFSFIKFKYKHLRDTNLPPALMCLKEILCAKLLQIDRNQATIEQIYAYQSCLAMNIVRFCHCPYIYSSNNVLKFFSWRFVNFITEPYQTTLLAKPIKSIALNVSFVKLSELN